MQLAHKKEIRTLFVTIMSYPLRGGTHLRNWQNIKIMCRFGEVGIFSVFNQDLQIPEDVAIDTWHHFNMDRESGLSDLTERGVRLLGRCGLRYFWAYSSRAARVLDGVIKSFRPDLIVLEELGTYPFLKVAKAHSCPVIFDDHNVEAHLFQQIHHAKAGQLHRLLGKFHLSQIRSAEAKLVRQAVQTWVCSEDDRQLTAQLYGSGHSVQVIPNAIDVEAYSEVRAGHYHLPEGLDDSPSNLLFLGNFYHPPNQEAADLLITEVYPRLRQLAAGCRLLLVGSNPTPAMLAAARQEPDIIVTGEVPDVKPYLAAAGAMLVPLLKGGGTRFKILEAFAAGCPVISTTKGAEGLHAEDNKHLLIADDAAAMVKCVKRIWEEEGLAGLLTESASILVRSSFSWDAAAGRVEQALAHIDYKRNVG
ncbi:MAG: glycosyltransferase family 4 protein [Saprospiraceae bacterium]|nr:glycosyltransferase [Lewinella sp.]